MAQPGAAVQAPRQQSPQQQDQMATQAILRNAIDRTQQVASQQVFPASNPQLIVQPLNVGLIKRFIIEVTGTITNSGSTTISLTDFGLANLFGQGGVQYTDLNNYLRVNTSGAHLAILSDAKRRRPFGGTYQANTNNGSNLSQMLNVGPATWGVFQAPQTIATTASGNFRAVFELPLAYSDDDLRGAIYANVLNAVQQITLTFNNAVVTANPNDNTFAVYSGAAGSAGSITSATVTIYQEYLDQLPMSQAGVVLPQLSLSTVYELKSVLYQGGIAQNQEFYISYANQRSFISTVAVFNSTGTNAGRLYGSDVSYWALLAANSSYIWKIDPLLAAQRSRDHLTIDLPAGTYYFPTRRKNLATLQYGNLQLTLNALSSDASAYCNVMLEDFALLNTLQSGASLSPGGN